MIENLEDLKAKVSELQTKRSQLQGRKETLEQQLVTSHKELLEQFGCKNLAEAEKLHTQFAGEIDEKAIEVRQLSEQIEEILKGGGQ